MNGNSDNFWLEILGFGLAAFDPTIGVIGLMFLLAGVRNRITLLFLGTAVAATWVIGVALSLTLGQLTAIPRGLDHLRHGQLRADLEVVTVICGLIWLAIRIKRGPDGSEPEPPNATERGAILLALAIVLVNLGDPAYLGGVLVVSHSDNMMDTFLGILLLAAAVQFPVGIVLAVMALGSPQRAAERFNRWWIRTAPHRFHALHICAFLIILALAVDAAYYITEGKYLVLHSSQHVPE